MTEEEWEQVMEDVNKNCKKWVDEEVFKAQYSVVKNIIQKDTQMNETPLTHEEMLDIARQREEENDKAFKDSLRLIEEWGEQNKPPTLKALLLEIAYNKNSVCPDFAGVDEILEIVEKWLPKESTRPSYDTMQWDKCVKRIKDTLR